MTLQYFVVFLLLVVSISGQRPSYAGRNPIGYPIIETTTSSSLGNRFGNDGTTERLPLEALGDRELINRLNRLPVDKQPFWFINWKAYEQSRSRPQTYEQRPNIFIDPIPNNQINQVQRGRGF